MRSSRRSRASLPSRPAARTPAAGSAPWARCRPGWHRGVYATGAGCKKARQSVRSGTGRCIGSRCSSPVRRKAPRPSPQAHDHGADGSAHAPHTVQPAHVAAFVMQGNVVVQGRIHAACAQAVGDSPQAEHPELSGDRESEQRGSGHAHTEGGHFARAQCPGEPVAVQAGNDGAQRETGTRGPGNVENPERNP